MATRPLVSAKLKVPMAKALAIPKAISYLGNQLRIPRKMYRTAVVLKALSRSKVTVVDDGLSVLLAGTIHRRIQHWQTHPTRITRIPKR